MKNMKRRTKVGLVKLHSEVKVRASFDSLPPELVVMVASNLDVSSYLALASSSSAIFDVLVSQTQWKALLQKTRMKNKILVSGFGFWFLETLDKSECYNYKLPRGLSVEFPMEVHTALNLEKKRMEEEVKEFAVFLKFVKDPKGVLLLALLHTICERLPADLTSEYGFMVSLSCPCQAVHQVNSFGFALIEQAETIVGGADAKPQLNLVAYKGSGLEHLEEFASRASRQKQKVVHIEMHSMKNGKGNSFGKAGEVWSKLIQNCKSWKIENLNFSEDSFEDDYNGLLEGLSKQTARGAIGKLLINDACIAKTKIGHLKKIWNITEAEWVLDSFGFSDISMRKDCEKWTKMSTRMKNIQTIMHNEKCVAVDMCTCVKEMCLRTCRCVKEICLKRD